ncbi:MAG: hypothetical protein ACI4PR_03930, partial [Acutalibacteraceae bacterium]
MGGPIGLKSGDSIGLELKEEELKDHSKGGENGNKSTNSTAVTSPNENKNENRKEVDSMLKYGTFDKETGTFTFNDDVTAINAAMVKEIVDLGNLSVVVGKNVQKIGE